MDSDPPELIDRRVAARIHSRRVEVGMTLQSLASQIGVAFQQAHKYERGLSRISAGRLYRVARALDVPVGFFFGPSDDADATSRSLPADRNSAIQPEPIIAGQLMPSIGHSGATE